LLCIIVAISYTKGPAVRTNIEIDDELMAKALRLTGLRTKRAVVEAGLRAVIEKRGRELLLEAAGKYPWDGDLDRMRGRPPRAAG
jgi:Arc/MetJ family transcription regulator